MGKKEKLIFRRYELKYLVPTALAPQLHELLAEYMTPDEYGKSVIQNIYYDTPDYRLIRHSIERPPYKEKLRLRSYGRANKDSTVFVELKKKFKGIVFKRRIALAYTAAQDYLDRRLPLDSPSQISKEIDYFMTLYNPLRPAVFIFYHREAYFSPIDGNFRITLDSDIRMRQKDISLSTGFYGQPILSADTFLMEVKTTLGLPQWLREFLDQNHLYKASFSKYGTAYNNIILSQQLGGTHHVA